ncbi:murein hydrolase activator EnvC family protein [Lysobacter korlensis]|uniref:Murein hydrolase activator EnvC family protein n=1 Tax=Lysobacter korlensis TaxID=553636 RepID=A0ABV6RR47_9GAMM
MTRHLRAVAFALCTLLALAFAIPAAAQSSREAERRLANVKRELDAVAAERRRLEGERGEAARQLRAADEKVGETGRRLRDLEQQLARDEAALATVQERRAAMRASLAGHRAELSQLLRAAYAQGEAAPLKALLAQDRIADGQRLLVYHRYLQRDRAQRIGQLGSELRQLDALERDVVQRRAQLDAMRDAQRRELAELERARKERARLVSRLDARYQDSRSREQALGRDARALEQLLKRLRVAAAARKKAERDAAARAVRREPARAAGSKRAAAPATRAPAPQVGGLGWPASGALLAGFGARMPDGRTSDGLLIGAPAGSPVKAVADGSVVYAEWMTGYGLLLIIDHGNGYMSLYAHNDALLKSSGQQVRRGDAVATVGTSGGHGRAAVYFELRRNGAPVNPASWLRR